MAKNSRYVGTRLATTVNARYYPDEKVIDAYYLDGRFTMQNESRAAEQTHDREDRGFLYALFAYPTEAGAQVEQTDFAETMRNLAREVKHGPQSIDTEINDLADLAIEVGGKATLAQEGIRQSYFTGLIVKEGEIAAVTTADGCAFLYRSNVLYPLTSGDFEIEAIDLNGNPVQHLNDYSAGVAGTIRYSNLAQIQEDDLLLLCNRDVLDILGQREILRLLGESQTQEEAASSLITAAAAKQSDVSLQVLLASVDYVEAMTKDEQGTVQTVGHGQQGHMPSHASQSDEGLLPPYDHTQATIRFDGIATGAAAGATGADIASGRPRAGEPADGFHQDYYQSYDKRDFHAHDQASQADGTSPDYNAGADYVDSGFPDYQGQRGYTPGPYDSQAYSGDYDSDYGQDQYTGEVYGDGTYDPESYAEDAYGSYDEYQDPTTYQAPQGTGYGDEPYYTQDPNQAYGYGDGEYQDTGYYDQDGYYDDPNYYAGDQATGYYPQDSYQDSYQESYQDGYYDEYQDSYYDDYQQNYYDDAYGDYYEDQQSDKTKRIIFYVILVAIIAVCIFILARLLGGGGKPSQTTVGTTTERTTVERTTEATTEATTVESKDADESRETGDDQDDDTGQGDNDDPNTGNQGSSEGQIYTIKAGDTFFVILQSYYQRTDQAVVNLVLEANPQITNIDFLTEGVEMVLPPLTDGQ